MNAYHFHKIIPRGRISTGMRAAQDEARRARIQPSPGVRLAVGPRGTRITPVVKQAQNASGSTTIIPRWG